MVGIINSQVVNRFDLPEYRWQASVEVGIPFVMGFAGAQRFETEQEANEALPFLEELAQQELDKWIEDNCPWK